MGIRSSGAAEGGEEGGDFGLAAYAHFPHDVFYMGAHGFIVQVPAFGNFLGTEAAGKRGRNDIFLLGERKQAAQCFP